MDSELIETVEKEDKNSLKKRVIREILENVITILVAFAFALFLNHFIIVNARIPSSSMENTVMTGDRIFGNRLAYKNNIPERFDIIIFKYPDDESQLFIKRIIGLPGDTVDIVAGKVYINGSEEPLDDSFTKSIPTSGTFGPYFVPSDSYFVMGDNRYNSLDSRYWKNKFVRSDQILGKAVFRYYPFNHMGTIK